MEQVDLFDDHENDDNIPEEDPTWDDIANTVGDDYVFHLIGRIPNGRTSRPIPPCISRPKPDR
jgi:hypothetical protein